MAYTVLIIGGAGFIGSHVNALLNLAGHRTIIFDNLSSGSKNAILQGHFIEGDLLNPQDLDKVFTQYRIDVVVHLAALIDVGESILYPNKYYFHNVIGSIYLLEAMRLHQVKYLIFSSSAAIFGNPIEIPIKETHPCSPINPYGETKLFFEKILKDYDRAYGIKSSCLRYFNAAGARHDGSLKNYKKKESNLIPLLLKSLISPTGGSLKLYGTDYPTPDGTCIRDYVHVDDLSSAHILAMEQLIQENRSSQYNLGNGKGFSVLEVINMSEEVTGQKINVTKEPRREGDPPILVADSAKARLELGWNPLYADLKTILEDAWKSIQN